MNNLDINFIADKASGLPAETFLASIPPKVVEANNYRHFIKFPFYALNIDCERQYADEYIDAKLYKAETEKLLVYVRVHGTKYLEEIAILMTKEAKDFKKYSDKLILKLPRLSNRQLVDALGQYVNRFAYHFGYGAPTFVYEADLSERLSKSLLARYEAAPQIIGQVLSGKYRSFMVTSEKLLLEIKQTKNKEPLIKKYLQDFYFMGPGYIYAPAMTAKRVRQLAATVKPNKNHKKYLKTKFKLTNQEKIIVSILKPTEIIRDQRKYANQVGSYTLCRFWDEAVWRSRLPMRLAVRAFWTEYSDLIYQPQVIKKILAKRNKATVVTVGDNIMYLSGHRVKERQSLDKGQRSFIGTPACHGKVRGRVRIILGPADFKKFRNNEILVTDMTRPDFLPIMRHAKAIITNEGGLMSHAAIISRELHIPSVLGTRVATRVLKDGDLVEVDANKGIIKKLSKNK